MYYDPLFALVVVVFLSFKEKEKTRDHGCSVVACLDCDTFFWQCNWNSRRSATFFQFGFETAMGRNYKLCWYLLQISYATSKCYSNVWFRFSYLLVTFLVGLSLISICVYVTSRQGFYSSLQVQRNLEICPPCMLGSLASCEGMYKLVWYFICLLLLHYMKCKMSNWTFYWPYNWVPNVGVHTSHMVMG